MDDVRLTAVITEDHELNIIVPDDVPPGEVEVVIRKMPASNTNTYTRSAVREKLAAAGILGSASHLPTGARIPTDAEVVAAGILAPGARPSEDLVSQDRDER